ncbi:UNKNOWN [Stylonychia lemnae]|uniref:Uncharacterized protein n=1 Tax=Stylonychia lemnae TaxID=5949 RepID=A0A078ACT6_STYLE|nr:UNKNOWN [Stylonychia lemnae]|eukprot:CDW80070.1 UNKNOWN [Stylonychia lemnae]
MNRRPKGFVDFDLQLARPDVQKTNAHDNRFEPFEYFPPTSSKTRHSPKIIFDQMVSRNEKSQQNQMSDGLFDPQRHMNLYKPKPRGILHFGRMHIDKSESQNGRKYKRFQPLSQPKMTLDDRIQEELRQFREVKGPILDKQFPRINPKTSELPVHMQNIHGRLSINNQLGRTIVEINAKSNQFMDPRSTFNTKKDFRAGSFRKSRHSSLDKPINEIKKRNLTFNQMLAKYGYIEDESTSKKQRIRPWHIKKNKRSDESSDESDDL